MQASKMPTQGICGPKKKLSFGGNFRNYLFG